MRPTTSAIIWNIVHADSATRGLGAAAIAVALLAGSGCATGTLDQRSRHLFTAGLGAAALDDGASELHGSWVVHGAYDYRLTALDGWLAASARMVTYGVLGASATGERIARPCDLFWASAGPAFGLQFPANYPLSLVADAGAALAYVSRSGCSGSGRTTATAVVPQLGFGMLVGMSPNAAWKLGGRYVRLPLDEVGVEHAPTWASAGEISVVIAF